ncbi:MAG: 2-phosphosulfolactate phosphatase, partial [Candidatus Methylomirabilales bacterium]
ANGARAVIPAASSEEAVRLAGNLEKNGVILAGERKGIKIAGFALGNSPLEMTREAVEGKTIVLSTTNGTPALVASQGAGAVFLAAVINFQAAAQRARDELAARGHLVVLCAGRETQFALEDAYAAGRLVQAVKKGMKKLALNDAATTAVQLAGHYKSWASAVTRSDAAAQLKAADLWADVEAACRPDVHATVPLLADRRVTL